MEVTVASGLITVELSNGNQTLYPADAIISTSVMNKPVFTYGANTDSQVTRTDQWFVRAKLKDNTAVDFLMGKITNEATWVNTQAGANIALAALDGVFA